MLASSVIQKKGFALDFEGNLKKGIREMGIIEFNNFKIINAYELDVQNKDETMFILNNLNQDYEFIICHNWHIEKNLLTDVFPYPSLKEKNENCKWGPWLDSLKIYKTFYPNLESYELINLCKTFLKEDQIKLTIEKICPKYKTFNPHNALYDATGSFLLIKRLAEKFNLSNFLQQ